MRVIYRKLGRHKADGLAHSKHFGTADQPTIEVDERLKGARLLETLIHEMLHIQNPEWEEKEVDRKAKEITILLWKQNFRKVEK